MGKSGDLLFGDINPWEKNQSIKNDCIKKISGESG
jgi:hypothetical protein